jgi:large subunit ribosomal protein L21
MAPIWLQSWPGLGATVSMHTAYLQQASGRAAQTDAGPSSQGDTPEMQVSTVSSGRQAAAGTPGVGEAKSTERSYMYAVIKTGGKQYKVAAGEKIKVEQIAADVGQEIVLDQVLAVGNGAELTVGAPLVAGASVKATVVAQGRHDKVRIFKMRRRKHYQKHGGHRQHFTELEISSVNA